MPGRSPRARGNHVARSPDGARAGPRARGNLGQPSHRQPEEGPIPAGAGKPAAASDRRARARADPRGRGETTLGDIEPEHSAGRSPRARGNRLATSRGLRPLRPIPAGAGKPPRSRRRGASTWADPRGRGETSSAMTPFNPVDGRSPRARGNPAPARSTSRCRRPIPAGAGKPWRRSAARALERADPRGRGETLRARQTTSRPPGRSPRARGNHTYVMEWIARAGPIPAGAGKPGRRARRGLGAGADPRGRGETPSPSSDHPRSYGRSPRARGNLQQRGSLGRLAGPIPAGAGKPVRQ